MSSEYETLTVRPPWRDELPRLKTFLAEGPLAPMPWRFLVLNASNPERILGAAGLRVEEDSGELLLNLRPRVLHEGRGDVLLDAVITMARELKLAKLAARVTEGSPQDHFLRAMGFEESCTEEIWRLDLTSLKSRLERFCGRVKMPKDWVVRAPVNDDLPRLAAMFEAHGLVIPNRLRPGTSRPSDDPGSVAKLSSLVENSGRVLAGLMVEGSSGFDCHVALVAVAREASNVSGPLLGSLLGQAVQNWIGQGYENVTFKVDVARNPATQNLARRTGGVLLQRVRRLVREL